MIVTRRRVLGFGGGSLAVLLAGPAAAADELVAIGMWGDADGSRVWFDPVGLHVRPGQTIRWTNLDKGNSHTVTAYHPVFFERPVRIPEAAKPFHSDYLLPGETFSVRFSVEGVYDYYCVPHEHAGMVGRIVVGAPPRQEPPAGSADSGLTPLPDVALNGFPSVDEILARGVVRRHA